MEDQIKQKKNVSGQLNSVLKKLIKFDNKVLKFNPLKSSK